MAENKDPSTPSADHKAMASYWAMVSAITGGVASMRAAGERYLPRFEAETNESHKRRLKIARMTNVFADIVADLTMRPFAKPTTLSDASTQALKDYSEDVDARGTGLNVFAAKLFRNALKDGLTWVLVDYTKDIPENATIAEERKIGARPFWVQYRAADVLAVYSKRVNGEERIVEARLSEVSTERDGFDEKTVERVRVFRHDEGMEAPEWELWRKKTDAKASVDGGEWILEEGPNTLSIDAIPLVPVVFGERHGNSWMVDPPLRDAAYLQLELYQSENALKNVRNLTAYPMLAGNGMDPELGEDGKPTPVLIGPNAVLYGGGGADGGGEWDYVEPAGQSLTFLREDIKDTIRELRELGRQPLVATAGLTVITTASAARKTGTAIQAWASLLADALATCFAVTGKWLNLNDATVEVMIHDDFDLSFGDEATFENVLQMGTGAAPIISREAVIAEAKRRGILGPRYDPEADLELIEPNADGP